MADKKLKMSNKRFMAIWIPIVSILVVLVIAMQVAGSLFGIVLDTQLGRGERVSTVPEDRSDWDAKYYNQLYTSEEYEKSRDASLKLCEEVGEEGFVLLKNDGTLPLKKNSTVTPFGRGYVFPEYNTSLWICSGKSTTFSGDYAFTPEEGLSSTFKINSVAANLQPETDSNESYPDRPTYAPSTWTVDNSIFYGGSINELRELSVKAYDKLSDEQVTSMKDTTGLVFITRFGNENNDNRMEPYDDGTPHYLALSQNEKDMIAYAKEKCSKVVLILNHCGAFELDPVVRGELEVNAILWVGNPGDTGFNALGKFYVATSILRAERWIFLRLTLQKILLTILTAISAIRVRAETWTTIRVIRECLSWSIVRACTWAIAITRLPTRWILPLFTAN